jgi:pimeloyl-ACP methyl ester carboxylesterase
LVKIRTPVLLVAGDKDAVRTEHILELRSLIPDAQLAIIPDASHFVLSEKSELVDPMIIEFLKQ